jgi:hypothetical protein
VQSTGGIPIQELIPKKKLGIFLLCSCDIKDIDMEKLGYVLLNLTGVESINALPKNQSNENLLSNIMWIF